MSSRNGQKYEQLLSGLRSAKNRLEYLTPNDWALIIDRAEQVHFAKSEELIREGASVNIVYVIATGTVNVTLSSGTRLARLGPGEVCGEMAFLESGLASATATADEDLEAFALSWEQLSDLFELFPHLASRFHRSLAVNLSRRLRKQIARQLSES